jgi:hypothetical protein
LSGELVDLYLGIAVVIATILGPVLAVFVTRHIDWKRQTRERRLEIFRSLMATRRAPLAADKVKALNMVEIDFYGDSKVLEAHKDVMDHINTTHGDVQQWDDRHRKLMTKLLSEMAISLGYKLQQLDVLDGGYYPQGYADIEAQQREVRLALIQTLTGKRPLAVSPSAPTPPQPFPPPPPPSAVPGTKR